jgi:hypothetical protein
MGTGGFLIQCTWWGVGTVRPDTAQATQMLMVTSITRLMKSESLRITTTIVFFKDKPIQVSSVLEYIIS